MKAYSIDLRQKILSIVQKKELKLVEIANIFSVSLSTVKNFARQYRKNKTIAPKPHGGGVPALIHDEGKLFLQKLLKDRCDLTLEELRRLYFKQFSTELSVSTMSRTLRLMGYSRKKKLIMLQK